jgi:hypothetical protein
MRSTGVSGFQLTVAVNGPAAVGWMYSLVDEVAPSDPVKVWVVCVGQADPVEVVLVVVEVLVLVEEDVVEVEVVVVPVVVEPLDVVLEVVVEAQLHG